MVHSVSSMQDINLQMFFYSVNEPSNFSLFSPDTMSVEMKSKYHKIDESKVIFHKQSLAVKYNLI